MFATQPASLTVQLITVSIITLQRQLSHNLLANRNEWNSEYDFVVVGAGTAGCVVAARLSENTNFSVLLIEAGGPDTVITDMAAEWFSAANSPELNWGYATTAQSRLAQAYGDRISILPRGRVMGGTNSINGLVYNRGNRRVYDGWAHKYGANGWSYDEVLPYFIRSENNTDPDIVSANPEYHGTNGPLEVSSDTNPDPIFRELLNELTLLGYPSNDWNAGSQLGTMMNQLTINSNGIRGSTANNFLQPIFRQRSNLHIICRSLVTRILTRRRSDNTIEAYGVLFTRDGREYTVNIRREIIVSGGTINSAQLLMLSGIGPADHLRQFGIPVVADLPVGDHLVDHINLEQNYIANNASDISTDLELRVDSLYQFYALGSGPLTRFPSMFTYISTPLNDDPNWPDGIFTVTVFPISNNMSELTARVIPERRAEWRDFYAPLVLNYNRIINIGSIIFRPKSRGSVRLVSRDPTVAPLIDPNYYSDARDLAVHVGLTSRAMEIAGSPGFRKFITANRLPIPGCPACGPTVPLFRCYSYLACLVESLTMSGWHLSGTCRMGSATDPNAVLDERLRVRGVSRLRVMDASVFPEIPNANPSAATIMVAERGSDFVKRDNDFRDIY